MGSYQACCVYPHGRRSIYIMCLALSAAFMSLCATWGCYFIKVDATFSTIGAEDITRIDDKAGWGLFTYEDGIRRDDDHNWKCYRYTDRQEDKLDDPFGTAQLLGLISNVLLGIAAVLFLLASCCAFPRLIVLVTALIELLGGCALGATLLVLGTEFCSDPYDCKFYVGAAFAVLGAVVAIINACVMITLQPAKYLFESPVLDGSLVAFSPGTETITETRMFDGTKKVTKTTTHDDGAQTIEETVYDPDEK
mmetsp:Transcript_225/g.414  ORF Transcript_225/g.414 Transcript_225/m.414 type:complete len:251 (-) Transcript_225:177-929(-)